ncbi:MAG: DUF302 domain-containing protein [Thiomargarita sp.]|nr:DUF302 domain-containing protein [Thiomargarita sp.]
MINQTLANVANFEQLIIQVPIKQNSLDEAADYLKQQMQILNIPLISHSPLYKEYEALGLSNIRQTEFFQFCDFKTAKTLTDLNMDYAAFLPCRIALVADQQNQGWFIMLDYTKLFGEVPDEIKKQLGTTCKHLKNIIGINDKLPNTIKIDLTKLVVKTPISEDVSIEDAIDSLKLRANILNMKLVSQQNFTTEYKKLGLSNIKTTEIFQFCDARISQKLLENNLAYAAYMPCRIALVEDKTGKAWLVMMNLEALLQSSNLPPELHQKAKKISDALLEIIEAGASGDL